MSNTIEGLRERLFAVIDAVKAGSMDLEKAKTINDTAQVIVNSAKVEVDYLRAIESTTGSAFLGPVTEETDETRQLPNGVVRVVQHRMKG